VIISEKLAKSFFPGEDPLGKHIKTGGDGGNSGGKIYTIVGIVGDMRYDISKGGTKRQTTVAMRLSNMTAPRDDFLGNARCTQRVTLCSNRLLTRKPITSDSLQMHLYIYPRGQCTFASSWSARPRNRSGQNDLASLPVGVIDHTALVIPDHRAVGLGVGRRPLESRYARVSGRSKGSPG